MHEHQPNSRSQFFRDSRYITTHYGREVGVGYRRVAAPDHLHQWRHFVADRYLSETQSAREFAHCRFVRGITIAVDENHGTGVDAVGQRGF